MEERNSFLFTRHYYIPFFGLFLGGVSYFVNPFNCIYTFEIVFDVHQAICAVVLSIHIIAPFDFSKQSNN